MANKQGKDDVLQVSADGGTTWLTAVCETTHTFNFTRNSSRVATKCDNGTSQLVLGAFEWSFQAGFVVKTDPTVSEASFEQMLGWAKAGTLLQIRNADPNPAGTNWYLLGQVAITDLSKTAEAEGLVSIDVTFSGNGDIDTTP